MSENPSYYAIIPATVRYDKDLKPNAKLLYGEITCLAQKTGYCYASNSYFAELYGVDNSSISRWVNQLAEKGYITLYYEFNGKECKERRIKICDTVLQNNQEGVLQKSQKGIAKKSKGYCKKVKENNTSNNNTSNNNTSNNITRDETIDYKQFSDKYLQNRKTLFESGKLETEKIVINYARVNKRIKELIAIYSKEQILSAIDKAMNDDWIVSGGYAFTTILADSQINKLVSAKEKLASNDMFDRIPL